MSQEIERVADSLERLHEDGISPASSELLSRPAISTAIADALGETGSASELVLVSILVDDSTSIGGNLQEICFGYDTMLEALREDELAAEVMVMTSLLNRGVLMPYRPLATVPALPEQGYRGARLVGETPLYLQSLLTLGAVMVKAREEESRSARVRTFTLLISDAEDNASKDITAQNVKAVVTDMLEFAMNHLIFGMGVGERVDVDFYKVFGEMGIPGRPPREWIFSAGIGVEELRAKFREITQLLKLAASSETAFLQLVAGASS
jgi:hypothetical protein